MIFRNLIEKKFFLTCSWWKKWMMKIWCWKIKKNLVMNIVVYQKFTNEISLLKTTYICLCWKDERFVLNLRSTPIVNYLWFWCVKISHLMLMPWTLYFRYKFQFYVLMNMKQIFGECIFWVKNLSKKLDRLRGAEEYRKAYKKLLPKLKIEMFSGFRNLWNICFDMLWKQREKNLFEH